MIVNDHYSTPISEIQERRKRLFKGKRFEKKVNHKCTNVAPYTIFHSTLIYKRLIVYHRMMSKKKTSGEKSLGHRSEKPPPYT